MGYLPADSAQWGALVKYLAGGLVAGACAPWMWPFVGPFAWLAWGTAIASQESLYDSLPGAPGNEANGTGSYGIARFNDANTVFQRTGFDRSSPFLSGMASVANLHTALYDVRHPVRSFLWMLALVCPILNGAYVRWLWTHGPQGMDSAGPVEVFERWMSEPFEPGQGNSRSFPTWLRVRAVTFLLGSLPALAFGCYLWRRK